MKYTDEYADDDKKKAINLNLWTQATIFVANRIVTDRVCVGCGSCVLKSDSEEYEYQCLMCDEPLKEPQTVEIPDCPVSACEFGELVARAYDYMMADKGREKAGFGDVTEWKERAEKHRVQVLPDGTIKQLYSDEEVEDIARQRDEYKHRAEVAERALLLACANLVKDEKDNVNMELLARVVYTKFLRKAEQEMTEEQR